MDEFELIHRFFQRDSGSSDVLIGIGDDGAVLRPSVDRDQVQVIDTLVAGVHFPADTHAADIAFRAVAVNLSDIAAMGAQARWMTLALTIPDAASDDWLQSFATGLFEAADAYDISLVGGDTTQGPEVVVTVAMTGEVERGAALSRGGAEAGDSIYVTGTLGDAAAGLEQLQCGQSDRYLRDRFLRPTARVETGRQLLGKAHAAIDISDGFAGDLKKLLVASAVGAEIDIDKLPLSDALCRTYSVPQQHRFALGGGDDYELCFTACAAALPPLAGVSEIGIVTESPELRFFLNGDVVETDCGGYRHFS